MVLLHLNLVILAIFQLYHDLVGLFLRLLILLLDIGYGWLIEVCWPSQSLKVIRNLFLLQLSWLCSWAIEDKLSVILLT